MPYFTDSSAYIWYNISVWKCIDFCEKPCTSEIKWQKSAHLKLRKILKTLSFSKFR